MLFYYHLLARPRKIIRSNQFRNIFLLHIAAQRTKRILWNKSCFKTFYYGRMFKLKHMQSRQNRVMNYHPASKLISGLPWWRSGWESACQCRGHGFEPWSGRSHMPRSGWARESQLLSLRVWSLCSATEEAATVRGSRTAMKSSPRSPQLEKALAQKRRPNTAKNK